VPPCITWIEIPEQGRLGIMAHPRGGPVLAETLEAMKVQGVELVLSLLEASEAEQLGIAGEGEACAEAGLEFQNLPVPEMGVPEAEPSAEVLVPLAERIGEGLCVVVHCQAGIGRSPTVAAALMGLMGVPCGEAFERIGRALGRDVPETQAQETWAEAFYEAFAEG